MYQNNEEPVLVCFNKEKLVSFINILSECWNESKEEKDINVFGNCFVSALKEIELNTRVFSSNERIQSCANIYASWINSYREEIELPEFIVENMYNEES